MANTTKQTAIQKIQAATKDRLFVALRHPDTDPAVRKLIERELDDRADRGSKLLGAGMSAESKALALHAALTALLHRYRGLVKDTNSEPTFGEDEAITTASIALFQNCPLADWEAAPSAAAVPVISIYYQASNWRSECGAVPEIEASNDSLFSLLNEMLHRVDGFTDSDLTKFVMSGLENDDRMDFIRFLYRDESLCSFDHERGARLIAKYDPTFPLSEKAKGATP